MQNLPAFHGPIILTRTTEAGEHWWVGRWEMEVGGWKLTVDVCPDHARVWSNLHEGGAESGVAIRTVRYCLSCGVGL